MTQETKNLHTPGAKDDDGKDTPGLILRDFPNAMRMVAHVATLGAKKYSESGWKEVPFARKRYLDAMMRHQLEIEMGNQVDHETKAPHSAHVAWNALALAQIDAERSRFYGRSFDFDYGEIPTREWDAHPTAQAAWDDAVRRKQEEALAVAKKVAQAASEVRVDFGETLASEGEEPQVGGRLNVFANIKEPAGTASVVASIRARYVDRTIEEIKRRLLESGSTNGA